LAPTVSRSKRLSALEDTNMAEAITGMAQADVAYRAALGAVNTVTRMSLMDYLR
jgi:flagellin-like hook-associated protein FlgL